MEETNKMQAKEVSILLIDHDPEEIKVINQFLSDSTRINAHVQSAESVGKAKTILYYNDIDIVVIDVNIDGENPTDFLDRLNQEKLAVPYIVITDERDEDLGIEAVKKGAQEYLVRSEFSERTLRRAILYSLERHEILDSLYRTTIVDELTELYNRRGFYTMGNEQIGLAKRHNEDIFIFYIDLDGMKEINDNAGHLYGDKALINTAGIMQRSFRNTDILARVGGDEFVAMAVRTKSKFVPIISQRIKDLVEEENSTLKEYQLSLSIGVSKVNLESKKPLDEAISVADKEMYKAKRENKKERT